MALPRRSRGHRKIAGIKIRKLALIWIACAALSWALTVVVGYSVMRFGDGGAGTEVMANSGGDDGALTAEAEALSNVAPAAGGTVIDTNAEQAETSY
jgi:hypothetical protein